LLKVDFRSNYLKRTYLFVLHSKPQSIYEIMSLWNIQTTEHDPIALKSDTETVKNNI